MLHAHICYRMATNRVKEAPAVRECKEALLEAEGDRDAVLPQEDDRYTTHVSGELLGESRADLGVSSCWV